MECKTCGNKKPKNDAKDFTKAVIEIDNPEQLVLLRKVSVPASLGDDTTYPPKIGQYHNVILSYEANDAIYLYSSDGMPVKVTANIAAAMQAIAQETADREHADAVLQQEIEDIKNSPDVVDIVDTYADLQSYDTSSLGDKDIIRVLQDETHDNDSSYYRWSTATTSWTFIGSIDTNPVTFRPFPSGVDTTHSTQDFMNSILALHPETGMAYLGTVSLSDMPAGLTQEEVEVYVYSNYVIYCVMRSTDVAPYQWWCASYNYQGWRPSGGGSTYTAGTNIQISSSNVISATDTTYSNFVGTDGQTAGTAGLVPAPATTDAGKFLKADGTWGTAGGGGPSVVQTAGGSTTDVMSQKAATEMVYSGGQIGALGYKLHGKIDINPYRYTSVDYDDMDHGDVIAIGRTSTPGSGSQGGIAIGGGTEPTQLAASIGFQSTTLNSTSPGDVALGAFSVASSPSSTTDPMGVVSVGRTTSTSYVRGGITESVPAFTRRIINVTDPINAQDVATKSYVDNNSNPSIKTIFLNIGLEDMAAGDTIAAYYDAQRTQLIPSLNFLGIIGDDTYVTVVDTYGCSGVLFYSDASDDYYCAIWSRRFNISSTNVANKSFSVDSVEWTYSDMTGATSQTAGEHGLVPAPAAGDESKVLLGDGTWGEKSDKFVIMKYGESNAWAKFLSAYQSNAIVYCRASSNTNPATGAQTRLAFMAYVNDETTPTNVEFQYVRSVNTKSASQQCDQVFVYKLTNVSGGTWSVETRDVASKIVAGTNMSSSYSNGTLTLDATVPTITMTATDPGEGSALAANNFIGVYGEDPIILDYSTTEINTGAKWVDGSAIYKKTVDIGTLPNSTTKTVAHGISNLDYCIQFWGTAKNSSGNHIVLPWPSKDVVSSAIELTVTSTDVSITTADGWPAAYSGYVTLYYTKSS